MNFVLHRLRRFVQRHRADQYMLALLLGFALSVALTRFFLELTGYPQLGNGTLHIAHLLWGGLLLFAATLLLVVLDHRRVYLVGAILSGVGIGLFIDEVGKFITRANDYFYPMAAPIIYAFFLLTVVVYLYTRRPPARDPRSEMYRVLALLKEVLDHDLNESEWLELRERLQHVAQHKSAPPDLARLAVALQGAVEPGALTVKPDAPGLWFRWQRWAARLEKRWLPRRVLRGLLVAALGMGGLLGLIELGALALATFGPLSVREALMAGLSDVRPSHLGWVWLSFGLGGVVSVLMLAAAGLLALGRDWRGVTLGYFSLLATLTTGNLFSFYYEQFSTIVAAAIQLALLLALLHYRRRYLA